MILIDIHQHVQLVLQDLAWVVPNSRVDEHGRPAAIDIVDCTCEGLSPAIHAERNRLSSVLVGEKGRHYTSLASEEGANALHNHSSGPSSDLGVTLGARERDHLVRTGDDLWLVQPVLLSLSDGFQHCRVVRAEVYEGMGDASLD